MANQSSEALSEDVAYDLMSGELRRETLRILSSDGQGWGVSNLATEIVARRASVPADEVRDEDRKRVVVALMHRNLPKLADADVVTFDFADETVETSERISDLEPLL